MQKKTRIIAAILITAMTIGSKCNQHSEFSIHEREISIVREILLINNDIINAIDDVMTENYDGSDEAFLKLERGVCILETWQQSTTAAWQAIRIWELAELDYQRKKEAGEIADKASASDASIKVRTYLVDIARLALLGYDIYDDWGKRPPGNIEKLIKAVGGYIGQPINEPLSVSCSEAF